MKCPYCDSIDSQVKDSRPNEDDGTIRRRRICNECGARFTTTERTQIRELTVHKTSGKTEPFDREKLRRSIRIACGKHDINNEKIEKITNSIHRQLETESESDTITSEYIGRIVAESLLNIDAIAYIRFVSVYQRFKTLSDFKRAIAKIPEAPEGAEACDLPPTKYKNGKLF